MLDAVQLLTQLSESSLRKRQDPWSDLPWPAEIHSDRWFMSPELISIHGTETFAAMPESQQKRLSFFETINFFSLNIHGETHLIDGLVARTQRPVAPELRTYLHHFVREEQEHMAVFARYCKRYAGKIYPDRNVAFPRTFAEGEEEFLFFAKVLIFEDIVGRYNKAMGHDQRLEKTTRAIHAYHHADELRHLAFGRRTLADLFADVRAIWPEETLGRVRHDLVDYIRSSWRAFYNPDVYADAGLEPSHALAVHAWNHPACRAHRVHMSHLCVEFLVEIGVFEEVPEP